MEEEKKISIRTNKLYQLLITECRYGYSRNNHLMPSCAYSDVKDLLEELLSIDPDCAIRTAKQLCEECISDQLTAHFYDGLDDDFGNRQEAIDFIKYLMDFVNKDKGEWKPYNYHLYEENLKRSSEIKYNIVSLNNFDIREDDLYSGYNSDLLKSYELKFLRQGLSREEANIELFENILGSKSGTFNRRNLLVNNKLVGKVFKIITPTNHKGEIYTIFMDKAPVK